MAETESPYSLEALKSFFMPGDPNDPRINPDLRKRIALAMMARQRKAPQNIGEGINAIGEAIGDRRMEERLLAQDAAANERRAADTRDVTGGALPSVGTGAVTGAQLPPIVAADTATETPASPVITGPPPPLTRSAGMPSPLPPDTAGAMPPPPMAIPPGTVPSITAQPPPGALPTPPGGSVDSRARAALILAARQQAARGGPPANPMEAGAQAPAALSPTPTSGPSPAPSPALGGDEFSSQNRPNPAAGIRPAPPPAPRPTAVADTELTQEPLTDIQRKALLKAKTRPWDNDLQADMKKIYDQEEIGRAFRQSVRTKHYEELRKQQDPQYQATLSKTKSEAATGAESAEIVRRTGMVPTEFFKRMDEEKTGVDLTLRAQGAQQLARKAIRDGVITGYGANMQIAGAKFADWAWKNGLQGNLAANTEIMQAALTSGLSEAIKTINGEGGAQVSNVDVKIAQGMAGTDPNLQMKTIQTIMDRAAEINHRKINRYEEKVSRYLGGHQAEQMYETGAKPIAEPEHVKELLDIQRASPAKAAIAKERFDATYGPGAFDLEMARYQRAQRARR